MKAVIKEQEDNKTIKTLKSGQVFIDTDGDLNIVAGNHIIYFDCLGEASCHTATLHEFNQDYLHEVSRVLPSGTTIEITV